MTIQPTRPKPIPLDHLLSETVGQITLFGRVHDVKPITAADYQFVRADDVDVDGLFSIVGRLVPTITEEEITRLTPRVVLAIVAIADGRVEQVAAQFPPPADDPNADRPAESASPPA